MGKIIFLPGIGLVGSAYLYIKNDRDRFAEEGVCVKNNVIKSYETSYSK